jgi:hypothetical protein
MRHRFKILCLLAVAGLSVMSLGVKTKAPRAQAGFRYAYAHADCAPWDGAAWRIVIQNDPVLPAQAARPVEKYPRYQISLWQSPVPINRWIQIDSAGADTGHLSWCPAEGKCESLTGRVRITRLSEKRIEGELRQRLKDKTGRELVFPFTAPVHPQRVLCG